VKAENHGRKAHGNLGRTDELSTEHSLFWKCAQVLGQILTRLLFDLKVHGRHNLPRHGGALIVSNHQSYLDPVVLAARLQRPLNFVGKSELFSCPISAWIMRRFNAFPLRQGKGDIGAIKETIHRLREGHMLNIYPEGGRTPDGLIHEFQKGVALIIRRANVPVIPAVIVGSFKAWPIQRKKWRTAPIEVRFGPPLKLDGLHTDEEIAGAVERELRRMFADVQNRREDAVPVHEGFILCRPTHAAA
jgi:1-acyl-sn-glycerol-3-phosphate acyltransferase